MSQEAVELDYDEVVAETDLAIGYDIGGDVIWIPKSVHSLDDDPNLKKIWVQEWFAEKEGMI